MAGVALFALLASVVVANNCTITPIYVDFHDRYVNGGLSVEYGLFIGVGTPSQNQSLWPSISHNETIFADTQFCQHSTAPDCNNQTHGIFVPEKSQTFKNAPNYQSLDTHSQNTTTGTDTLNIFVHYFDPSPASATHVNNLPVSVVSNYTSDRSPWFGPAGLLGLGPSSTVLQHLYDDRLISTRSFGLYMGTAYDRAQGAINGSLTIGGYDSGRFTGQVHNYTIGSSSTDAGAFKVQVQKITLTSGDGRSIDLHNSNFDAYITTSQFDLTLPQSVTQQFADLTSATQGSNDDNSLELPSTFQGNLTITLSSGLTVTYTTSDLANVSNISPISATPLSNSTSTPSPALLGTSFLSRVYFIANYDSQPASFHLATALPGGPYVQTQPLCPSTIPVATTPTKISSFSASGLTGAIVAGVVGGIGITCVIWWAIRRWLRRQHAADSGSPRTIDKAKNPITAYYADVSNGAGRTASSTRESPPSRGKASWSSEEGVDLSYFQQQRTQSRSPNQNSRRQQQQKQQQRAQSPEFGASFTTHSTAQSDTEMSTFATSFPSPNHQSQYHNQYSTTKNDSTSFSIPNPPLTPNTPLPLLASYDNTDSGGPQISRHHRSSSGDARRAQLGLTVKTEFDPPPRSSSALALLRENRAGSGRPSKSLGLGDAKRGVKVGASDENGTVKRKRGKENGSSLRKIFATAS